MRGRESAALRVGNLPTQQVGELLIAANPRIFAHTLAFCPVDFYIAGSVTSLRRRPRHITKDPAEAYLDG